MEMQRTKNSQDTLEAEEVARPALLDIKTYCKTIINKSVWYWHRETTNVTE